MYSLWFRVLVKDNVSLFDWAIDWNGMIEHCFKHLENFIIHIKNKVIFLIFFSPLSLYNLTRHHCTTLSTIILSYLSSASGNLQGGTTQSLPHPLAQCHLARKSKGLQQTLTQHIANEWSAKYISPPVNTSLPICQLSPFISIPSSSTSSQPPSIPIGCSRCKWPKP